MTITQCPDCNGKIETINKPHSFNIFHNGEKVNVTTTLPFRHCKRCDLLFLDWEGQKAQDKFVKDYKNGVVS
jgi:uncharacterized protein with PIN domain